MSVPGVVVEDRADGSIGLRHLEEAMGTVFSFALTAAAEDRASALVALADAVSWLHEVDRRFTTYAPGSEWLQVMEGALPLELAHPDVANVLARSDELREVTGGAFCVAAAGGRPPDAAAYVKGWAVQRAVNRLARGPLRSVFLNGGGDVAVTGRGEPWRIGIQDPFHPAGLAAVVELDQGGVATSGTYERGGHIVDPRTGEPANDMASATVVGPDLGVADAYATALFVTGEQGFSWLAATGYGAFLIDARGATATCGPLCLA
jgi:thiamine biosynthesis lipoprotein